MSISTAELLAAALDPAWSDEHTEAPCLVVDLDGAPDLSPGDLTSLAGWISAQPIPVLGAGGDNAALAACLDVAVGSESELRPVVEGIEANPEAAAVLIQVLRGSEDLDLLQALTVESLGYATLQAGPEFAAWLAGRRRQKPARALPDRADRVVMERQASTLNILLNSPDTRNSLSASMRDGLTAAFRLVAMDPGIEAVLVSGAGPSFCAGGDLEEFGLVDNPVAAHRIRMLRMPARYLAPHAHRYQFKVHGACIGAGIELPAFAGQLSASADAVFRLPEVGMGLIPGAGGCVSIPRRIGRQRTAFLALSGCDLDAESALDWGLIDAIET